MPLGDPPLNAAELDKAFDGSSTFSISDQSPRAPVSDSASATTFISTRRACTLEATSSLQLLVQSEPTSCLGVDLKHSAFPINQQAMILFVGDLNLVGAPDRCRVEGLIQLVDFFLRDELAQLPPARSQRLQDEQSYAASFPNAILGVRWDTFHLSAQCCRRKLYVPARFSGTML